ncbi:MAG: hypothetical protein WD046_00745 [Paracoccaceae bacterium]
MKNHLRLSYSSALAAVGVGACCILPVTFILLGMGGSWLAIFGKIAAASFYVLALSTLVIGYSYLIAYRRGALGRLKWWLSGATFMTAIAWLVVLNEGRLNDYLISRM